MRAGEYGVRGSRVRSADRCVHGAELAGTRCGTGGYTVRDWRVRGAGLAGTQRGTRGYTVRDPRVHGAGLAGTRCGTRGYAVRDSRVHGAGLAGTRCGTRGYTVRDSRVHGAGLAGTRWGRSGSQRGARGYAVRAVRSVARGSRVRSLGGQVRSERLAGTQSGPSGPPTSQWCPLPLAGGAVGGCAAWPPGGMAPFGPRPSGGEPAGSPCPEAPWAPRLCPSPPVEPAARSAWSSHGREASYGRTGRPRRRAHEAVKTEGNRATARARSIATMPRRW
jgi:hypothetical protein